MQAECRGLYWRRGIKNTSSRRTVMVHFDPKLTESYRRSLAHLISIHATGGTNDNDKFGAWLERKELKDGDDAWWGVMVDR